jgi:DNA-directed RNA polymerase specialized sigma24 family protein
LTAKEYLGQIKHIKLAISAKKRVLDGLREYADLVKTVEISSDTIKSSAITDPLKIVDEIVDLESEIKDNIKALVTAEQAALQSINRVVLPEYINILTDRYINCITLEKIAEIYDISYRTVCVRLGQALQIFRVENNMT